MHHDPDRVATALTRGDLPASQPWHTPTFSSPNGACVQVAPLPAAAVAVANSRDPRPEAPVLVFTAAEFDAHVRAVKAGEYDHLLA